jgi:hypothetical protein
LREEFGCGLMSARWLSRNESRQRLAGGETLDAILPEAFAVVREASRRVLGMRHYDVQILGGIILHRGSVAQVGFSVLLFDFGVAKTPVLLPCFSLGRRSEYLNARQHSPPPHCIFFALLVVHSLPATPNVSSPFYV